MFLFRRFVFLLALLMPAFVAVHAETNESSSTSAPVDGQAQAQAPADNPQMSVQERIRLRRQQREAQTIHDTYSQEWEGYLGMGYLRFIPGPDKQRVAYYAWDTGVTRYLSQRLGVTGDARGYFGTAFVGLNFAGITRPAISEYTFMGGPTYRVYLRPKYSVSVRAMGGTALGNFSSDTNGFGGVALGLYPDGWTYAISPSLLGEANISPNLSLRLSGDDLVTGFGSSTQNSFGFNLGFVYRFGKKLP
ncbi:MAG: hypothetical protein WCA37_05955 [Terracidiphilus sp.]